MAFSIGEILLGVLIMMYFAMALYVAIRISLQPIKLLEKILCIVALFAVPVFGLIIAALYLNNNKVKVA